LNSVDELSRLIHGYKNAEFRAKMIIKGVLQSCSEDNINPLCEQSIDVFEYIEKKYQNSVIRFLGYRSKCGFKRRKKLIDEPLPFDSLMSYLMDCSRKSGGFDIILDGCNNGRMNERRIRCFRNKVHCNHIHYEGNLFSTDALSNGRKSNRENGKSLSRRKSTKQPLTNATKCKVFFIVGYDDVSYYIKCGYGNNLHVGHPQLSSSENSNVSSKTMTTSQRSVMRLCDKAKTSDTSTLDIINSETTNKYTRHQVRYLKNW